MRNCILVVYEEQKSIFTDFFEEQDITEAFCFAAKTTKQNFFLDLFHLSETPKSLFWFMAKESQIKKLEQLCQNTFTAKESGLLLKLKKEKDMNSPTNSKLIVTVVKSGFTELVTEAAKQFEISGATIINGKGVGKSHSSFMGMGIDSEREVVLIAASDDIAKKLQNEIKKAVIKNPTVNGICFILPLEDFIKFDEQK